jgi:hypothetical protein
MGLSTLASADGAMRLSTFGAPPKFTDYLLAFDEKDEYFFNRSANWTSIRDADLIVVFTDRASDLDFVPAVLLPAYERLTSQFKSRVFFIPESTFRGTLDAQVVFIVLDELKARLHEEFSDPADLRDPRSVSCFAASVIYGNLLSQNARVPSAPVGCEALIDNQ